MTNQEFTKYFGPGDVSREMVNGNPGIFLRLGKTMIESLETVEDAVGDLLPAIHDPFAMNQFQLLERLNELGLPAVYNMTNEFGLYNPPAGLPVPFVQYWLCKSALYGRRLNRMKGTFAAMKSFLALIFIELVAIQEDDIDGAIPFDTGIVEGSEMTFDRDGRFWDSTSCNRCISVTLVVNWLPGLGLPSDGLDSRSAEEVETISQQIFRIVEWGLPVDCRLKEVMFGDTPIVDPDLREFSEEFNLGFN